MDSSDNPPGRMTDVAVVSKHAVRRMQASAKANTDFSLVTKTEQKRPPEPIEVGPWCDTRGSGEEAPRKTLIMMDFAAMVAEVDTGCSRNCDRQILPILTGFRAHSRFHY